MTEAEWIDRVQAQIADGQYFLAYDTCREARDAHPESLRLTLLGALALLRVGAVLEARRLLGPLEARLESGVSRTRRIIDAFRAAVRAASGGAQSAQLSDEAIGRFLSALDGLEVKGLDPSEADAPETLRLVSQIHVEIWSRLGTRGDLEHAREIVDQAFAAGGDPRDGLSAAVLAAMTGDLLRARELANRLDSSAGSDEPAEDDPVARFRWHANCGEIALLLGDDARACAAFSRAAALRPRHLPSVVERLRRFDLLERAGVAVPEPVKQILRPPSTVVFAGQALDAPEVSHVSFPPRLEAEVARVIAGELEALGAEVGFSCAGAGAELLFVEAMLDRGAEVHLFLPFAMDDFVRHRVAYAGGNWERRFRNVCKLASSITYATEEPYLGHVSLLRFNNLLIQGMARAHAVISMSRPHLVVLWDYAAESGVGSASDFIDNWSEVERLRLIDLDELRESASAVFARSAVAVQALAPAQGSGGGGESSACPDIPERVIRTMLFADIVGYSKLGEADLPLLWRALQEVKTGLAQSGERLRLIESWGDAIYAVMDSSLDMADYAFALIEAIQTMDAIGSGLSRRLQVRVGLHAGPVFEGAHPLTGRSIVYGSHVSRAARLEPVSLPGHVYASQQFVAMLLTEESALRHEARATGGQYHDRYVAEYLGMLSLAKNYGKQQVYHVRRANRPV